MNMDRHRHTVQIAIEWTHKSEIAVCSATSIQTEAGKIRNSRAPMCPAYDSKDIWYFRH